MPKLIQQRPFSGKPPSCALLQTCASLDRSRMTTIFALLACVAAALILQVDAAGLNAMFKTVKVLENQPKLTPEQKSKINEDQKPKIDGLTTGNIAPPADAGKTAFAVNREVIGGVISKRGQFPWQALVTIEGQYTCGGSLITPTFVLTAAHCIDQFIFFIVTLGGQNRTVFEEGRVTFEVMKTKAYKHPNYDDQNLNNDIAVVELPMPVTSTQYIKTIRLPTKKQATMTFVNSSVTISGWGRVSDDSYEASKVLNNVDLKVMSNAECVEAYGTEYVRMSNICVSGAEFKATCNGDSGGPLVLKDKDGLYIQVGLVSFGSSEGCAKGYPSVFTRVSAFLSWISSKSKLLIKTA